LDKTQNNLAGDKAKTGRIYKGGNTGVGHRGSGRWEWLRAGEGNEQSVAGQTQNEQMYGLYTHHQYGKHFKPLNMLKSILKVSSIIKTETVIKCLTKK